MRRARKWIGTLLVIFLAASAFYMISSTSDALVVMANEEESIAYLKDTKMTIGVGYGDYILINNASMEDEFSFTSSNKNVATVKKDKSWVTGISAGTAIITVTVTRNGTARKLGEIKVTVVDTYIDKTFKIGCSRGTSSDGKLPIHFNHFEATYTYKSSDPKTVEVDSFGSLYGLKYGSAYISVIEKYKGNVTYLGKTKVTVVKPQPLNNIKIPVTVEGYDVNPNLKYRDRRNSYKFTSMNKKILELNKETGDFIGKNYGKVKVKVTEILPNGKSRNIGYSMVEVVPTSYNSNYDYMDMEIYERAEMVLFVAALDNINELATYSFEAADSSIISVTSEKHKDDEGRVYQKYYFEGIKKGKTTLTIYEEFKGKKIPIATVNFTITETGVVFMFNPDDFDNKYEDGILSTTMYMKEEYYFDNVKEELIKEPYSDMSSVTFSSSNEQVVKVDSDGKITLVSEGTAIITATYGDISTQLKINVKP